MLPRHFPPYFPPVPYLHPLYVSPAPKESRERWGNQKESGKWVKKKGGCWTTLATASTAVGTETKGKCVCVCVWCTTAL